MRARRRPMCARPCVLPVCFDWTTGRTAIAPSIHARRVVVRAGEGLRLTLIHDLGGLRAGSPAVTVSSDDPSRWACRYVDDVGAGDLPAGDIATFSRTTFSGRFLEATVTVRGTWRCRQSTRDILLVAAAVGRSGPPHSSTFDGRPRTPVDDRPLLIFPRPPSGSSAAASSRRMLGFAARAMGYRIVVLDPDRVSLRRGRGPGCGWCL